MMRLMYLSRYLIPLALLLCGLFCPAAAHNGKTAYAIPLSGIIIDGKLDDWPEGMGVYPITEMLKGWS